MLFSLGRVLPLLFSHKLSWLERGRGSSSCKFSRSLMSTLINFTIFRGVVGLKDFIYIKYML